MRREGTNDPKERALQVRAGAVAKKRAPREGVASERGEGCYGGVLASESHRRRSHIGVGAASRQSRIGVGVALALITLA